MNDGEDAAAYQRLLELAALAEKAEIAALCLKKSRAGAHLATGQTIWARKWILESLGKRKP